MIAKQPMARNFGEAAVVYASRENAAAELRFVVRPDDDVAAIALRTFHGNRRAFFDCRDRGVGNRGFRQFDRRVGTACAITANKNVAAMCHTISRDERSAFEGNVRSGENNLSARTCRRACVDFSCDGKIAACGIRCSVNLTARTIGVLRRHLPVNRYILARRQPDMATAIGDTRRLNRAAVIAGKGVHIAARRDQPRLRSGNRARIRNIAATHTGRANKGVRAAILGLQHEIVRRHKRRRAVRRTDLAIIADGLPNKNHVAKAGNQCALVDDLPC